MRVKIILFALMGCFCVLITMQSPKTIPYDDSVGIDELIVEPDRINNYKLYLPHDVGYFTTDGYSVNSNYPQAPYTIIKYIGNSDCIACQLKLSAYKQVIDFLSRCTNINVGFVYIVNPVDGTELKRVLSRDNSSHMTIWVDPIDTLNSINGFTKCKNPVYLIDSLCNVLTIGDPTIDSGIMQLYSDVLADSFKHHYRSKTRLEIFPTEMSVGNIAAGDSLIRKFTVLNSGKVPFVLGSLIPSCECVSATLLSDTILPGEKSILRVVFCDDDVVGEFQREVVVIGNLSHELVLNISGCVLPK